MICYMKIEMIIEVRTVGQKKRRKKKEKKKWRKKNFLGTKWILRSTKNGVRMHPDKKKRDKNELLTKIEVRTWSNKKEIAYRN